MRGARWAKSGGRVNTERRSPGTRVAAAAFVPGGSSPMNQTVNAGRIESATIHEPASVSATTAARENAYSPDAPDNRKRGRKAATVVTEETSKGNAYVGRRRVRRHGPACPADPGRDVLDDDHAVVDQQAERDDDRRNRDLLQGNAERAHPEEREEDGKWHDHRRDQPPPEAPERR